MNTNTTNMNTKKLTALLATAISVGSTLAMTAAPANAGGKLPINHGTVIANGGLVAHNRPSIKAPRTFTVANRSKVTIDCKVPGTSVDGNRLWYRIVTEGTSEQWVAARYVRNDDGVPEYCAPRDTARGVTTARLNQRVGASVNDRSAAVYRKGSTVNLRCATGRGASTWYLTSLSRWVNASYVNADKVPSCVRF